MKAFLVTCGVLATLATAAQTSRAQPGGPPGGFPGGPGGFPGGGGGPPRPGTIFLGFNQDKLNLTAEQKKQLETLQKDVDARLAKILTADQKKSIQEMPGPFGGPGGFPGFKRADGPGGDRPAFNRGFGGPGAGRLDEVKTQLKARDEEWKVMGPKLRKVIAARQVLTASAGGGEVAVGAPGGAFGGPPGPFGGGGSSNAISRAQNDLKTLLNDSKHSAAEVREKMAAVRAARQQARADLEAAQRDLVPLLTAEQEAVLVSLGYLD
jgi:Spy/CpxP family protein refolding chaperone